MNGWTPDGRAVELTPRQAESVSALLSRDPATLPPRPHGSGWSTVLATAARYDKSGVGSWPAALRDAQERREAENASPTMTAASSQPKHDTPPVSGASRG
jgi:hypothetical protein